MFKEILTEEAIQNFVNSVYTTILLPKSGGNPLGVITTDGRPCITSPTQDPTPGKAGSPPEPNYNGSAGTKVDSTNTSTPGSSPNGSVDKNAN